MSKILVVLVALLFCAACTALTPTPTTTPSDTPSATDTDSPTPTESPTETLTPSETPSATHTDTSTPTDTETPTETPSATRTPSNTPTDTQTITRTPEAQEPTPTPEFFVSTESELYACLSHPEPRACVITDGIETTLKTPAIAPNVLITCTAHGSLTNAASNVNRVLEIINAADVTVEDCTLYRQVNTAPSCCADTLLIMNSARITLRRVTLLYGVDEILDIQQSSDVRVEASIIGMALNCSTHTKGCHGYCSLITNSEVVMTATVITSCKARMPQGQRSILVMSGNVIQNWDGSAVAMVDESRLTFVGNIAKAGLDTDAINYVIVTPNREDYAVDPTICEAGNLLIGGYRVRRPADRDSYLAIGCSSVPVPPAAELLRIVEGAGNAGAWTARVRLCVLDGSCRIIDVPP